jgi:hypothetical protein
MALFVKDGPFLDRRDELALAHPARPGYPQGLAKALKLRQQHRRESRVSPLMPRGRTGRGGFGSRTIAIRLGGDCVRCACLAGEKLCGFAH